MRAIAVDDELISLEILQLQLEKVDEIEEVFPFSGPEDAIAWLRENNADIAFLDIIMEGMNGIDLAQEIEKIQPNCHIVFVSGSKEYALEAFRIHASGYLVKPVTKAAIEEELSHIFRFHPLVPSAKKPLRAQCFGNFDVFDSDGRPLQFKYKKSKELLAYLIHRCGATCSLRELSAVLYEDRDDDDALQSQMRNLVSDLTRTLKNAGAGDAIYKTRGNLCVIPEQIACDYYDFNKGNEKAIMAYKGEYMTQYEWSELTISYLENKRGL